jgi:hypothetical protein
LLIAAGSVGMANKARDIVDTEVQRDKDRLDGKDTNTRQNLKQAGNIAGLIINAVPVLGHAVGPLVSASVNIAQHSHGASNAVQAAYKVGKEMTATGLAAKSTQTVATSAGILSSTGVTGGVNTVLDLRAETRESPRRATPLQGNLTYVDPMAGAERTAPVGDVIKTFRSAVLSPRFAGPSYHFSPATDYYVDGLRDAVEDMKDTRSISVGLVGLMQEMQGHPTKVLRLPGDPDAASEPTVSRGLKDLKQKLLKEAQRELGRRNQAPQNAGNDPELLDAYKRRYSQVRNQAHSHLESLQDAFGAHHMAAAQTLYKRVTSAPQAADRAAGKASATDDTHVAYDGAFVSYEHGNRAALVLDLSGPQPRVYHAFSGMGDVLPHEKKEHGLATTQEMSGVLSGGGVKGYDAVYRHAADQTARFKAAADDVLGARSVDPSVPYFAVTGFSQGGLKAAMSAGFNRLPAITNEAQLPSERILDPLYKAHPEFQDYWAKHLLVFGSENERVQHKEQYKWVAGSVSYRNYAYFNASPPGKGLYRRTDKKGNTKAEHIDLTHGQTMVNFKQAAWWEPDPDGQGKMRQLGIDVQDRDSVAQQKDTYDPTANGRLVEQAVGGGDQQSKLDLLAASVPASVNSSLARLQEDRLQAADPHAGAGNRGGGFNIRALNFASMPNSGSIMSNDLPAAIQGGKGAQDDDEADDQRSATYAHTAAARRAAAYLARHDIQDDRVRDVLVRATAMMFDTSANAKQFGKMHDIDDFKGLTAALNRCIAPGMDDDEIDELDSTGNSAHREEFDRQVGNARVSMSDLVAINREVDALFQKGYLGLHPDNLKQQIGRFTDAGIEAA